MALQINVHRDIDFETMTRNPWRVEFNKYESFIVCKVQCGSDSVTFFDDDMEQFMTALLSAWGELHGLADDNEL